MVEMGKYNSFYKKLMKIMSLNYVIFLMFTSEKRTLGLLPFAASDCRKLQYLVCYIPKFSEGVFPMLPLHNRARS